MNRLSDLFKRARIDWQRAGNSAFDFAKTLVIAFLLAQLVMVSVAQAFQVEQYSMEPTLLPHDRVLVNKFLYRLREPRHGDIVVLRYPRDPHRNYIKRIVGLPGDKVQITDGHLVVNGERIVELYVNDKSGKPSGNYDVTTVPEDSFFVLGDNRNNSEDSRAFGFLKRSQVVGQAVMIYWPLNRIQVLRVPEP
jgi:signal peptidase I